MIDPSTDTDSVSGHLPYDSFFDPEVLVALCWQVAVNNDRLLTPRPPDTRSFGCMLRAESSLHLHSPLDPPFHKPDVFLGSFL